MTKSKQPKSDKSKADEQRTYSAVGLVFLIVGLAMIIPEGTRATGLPFLVLGLTFFIISQNKPSSKRKK